MLCGMFKSVPLKYAKIMSTGIFTVTEQASMSQEELHRNA